MVLYSTTLLYSGIILSLTITAIILLCRNCRICTQKSSTSGCNSNSSASSLTGSPVASSSRISSPKRTDLKKSGKLDSSAPNPKSDDSVLISGINSGLKTLPLNSNSVDPNKCLVDKSQTNYVSSEIASHQTQDINDTTKNMPSSTAAVNTFARSEPVVDLQG